MNDPKIISEVPLSLSELQSHIEAIKKRDKEPNIRVTKTDEYVQTFVSLDHAKSAELKGKLQKLEIPRMKDEHVSKIIDILPASVEELKAILQGYIVTISKENMKKIVDAVQEYVPGKKKK
ncbi:MAG TPA: hypothetical protein VJC16_02270 [Candidatus Nanoarchaeia archaeon]|nr:hypothetical protein [Candidatus Nanoarchaeia archaeon]